MRNFALCLGDFKRVARNMGMCSEESYIEMLGMWKFECN